jgi:hypothetical protein
MAGSQVVWCCLQLLTLISVSVPIQCSTADVITSWLDHCVRTIVRHLDEVFKKGKMLIQSRQHHLPHFVNSIVVVFLHNFHWSPVCVLTINKKKMEKITRVISYTFTIIISQET